MQETHTDRAWERRFRLPLVLATQIARLRPERGPVMGGSYQLYAWHVPGGRLMQLTFGSANIQRGHRSADGEHVYYLHDKAGEERGHFVRVLFAGGDPEDISPDLPPYSSYVFTSSGDGSTLAYVALICGGRAVVPAARRSEWHPRRSPAPSPGRSSRVDDSLPRCGPRRVLPAQSPSERRVVDCCAGDDIRRCGGDHP